MVGEVTKGKALQLSKEILILKAAQARGDGVSQLAIDSKVGDQIGAALGQDRDVLTRNPRHRGQMREQ